MQSARLSLFSAIRNGLFVRLTMERKVVLCRLLLDTVGELQEAVCLFNSKPFLLVNLVVLGVSLSDTA